MKRAILLGPFVLTLAACGGEEAPQVPAPGEPIAEVVPDEVVAEDPAERAAERGLDEIEVRLYFPSSGGTGLVGETRSIYETREPEDRIKQIVAALIEGPEARGALRALPTEVALRQVYVSRGEVWLDFSEEISAQLAGGSQRELLTLYALVDSVALNIEEVDRVGLLVGGRSVDTLQGHLDLRRPLPADRSWILR